MRKLRIPDVVIRRLPVYLRVLETLDEEVHGGLISSFELGERAGVTPAQVRKDLNFLGGFGKQGVGYQIGVLRGELRSVLNLDKEINVAIVGAGSLGQALARYIIGRRAVEKDYHLRMVALFDSDRAKVGRKIGDVPIYHVDEIAERVRERQVRMAIVAVPAEVAQKVVNACVNAGIEAILNFAPVKLKVPDGVRLHDTDLSVELMHLAYYL
ncbi:MAG: redox-sensing transcriptional repressor Rex [Bacillota bacterium]